jgi:hypothetical protein
VDKRDYYQKACDIADTLLSRGYPVESYEAIDDMIIVRFGGQRGQTIHASAGGASFEGFAQAFDERPPR